jgi:predicted signal transduction protein with EAL and GGDEF domain
VLGYSSILVAAIYLRWAGLSPDQEVKLEARVLHGDRRWHWHEILIRNLLDDPAVGGVVINHRDIDERRRYQERPTFEATHDPLTALPTRVLFLDRLGDAISAIGSLGNVGVLYIDLDRFEQVNDTCGHDAGDRLLVEASARVLAVLRPGDTFARLGGDEFTVLLAGIRDTGSRRARPDSRCSTRWSTPRPRCARRPNAPCEPR